MAQVDDMAKSSPFIYLLLFFLIERGKMLQGESFLLLFRMDERIDNPMEMLPNTKWEATHLVKQCALKLALIETFSAFQL